MRVRVTDDQVRAWVRSGTDRQSICRACGWTDRQLDERIRLVFGEPAEGDPDPETIAARCAEIQASWTDAEKRRRAAFTSLRQGPPRGLASRKVASTSGRKAGCAASLAATLDCKKSSCDLVSRRCDGVTNTHDASSKAITPCCSTACLLPSTNCNQSKHRST